MQELDGQILSTLNRVIHSPGYIPQDHWYYIRGLKSVKTLSNSQYLASKINRGLNSSVNFVSKTFNFSYCTIPNPPLLNYLPTPNQILPDLNLDLVKSDPIPETIPMSIFSPDPIRIFTDASLKGELGGCAVYCPNTISYTFTPTGHLSSTNFEIQSIQKAIQLCKETPHLTIFTDSANAIKAITRFRKSNLNQQLKSSSYPFLLDISNLLSYREKYQFHTSFHHVYSHLLDSRKPENYTLKLQRMTELYGENTTAILEGNQQADFLASSHLQPINPMTIHTPNLPTFVIVKNSVVIDSHSLATLNKHQLDERLMFLKKRNYKVQSWMFDPSIDVKLSTKILVNKFDNYLHRATHSVLATKERMSKFFRKYSPSHIHPFRLSKLLDIYSNTHCNLCPNKIDNHQHVRSTCCLTLLIHERLFNEITLLLSQHKALPSDFRAWFSTSACTVETDPTLQLGDKGLIPTWLAQTICQQNPSNLDQLLLSILKTFQKYMVAKVKLRTHVNYNNITSLHAITSNSTLLTALGIKLLKKKTWQSLN